METNVTTPFSRLVVWIRETRAVSLRFLAALRHGDLHAMKVAREDMRRLVLWGRKRSRQGFLPGGTVLRPYPALPVDSFDAHQVLVEIDATVTSALADAGCRFIRAPRGTAQRSRIVVSATDTALAAKAIALSPDAYKLQVLPLGRDGRPKRGVRPGDYRSLKRYLRRGGARVFIPMCAPNGGPLGAQEYGCDLEVWRVRTTPTHRLDPPWPNDWARSIPWEIWTDANAVPEHRPEELREPSLFEVREPIDVVYTWVDGSDPAWQQRKQRAEGQGVTDLNELAANWSRFESNDELRFSLRSVAMYASWVRRIFIVTDQQCPPWLDLSHPQITLVDHKEIFPPDSTLPTFNSHAIESRLHHIEGLAERYLYLNDDVFFGRIVAPELFFQANGIAQFFPSEGVLDLEPPSSKDLPVMSAGKRNRDFILEEFGASVSHKFKHTPHPQQRAVLQEMEEGYPELFRQLANSPFRSPEDHSIASALQHFYAFARGKAIPVEHDYFYLDIADPQAARHLTGLLRTKKFDFFCINNVASPAEDRLAQGELLREFLANYFPVASPYELKEY